MSDWLAGRQYPSTANLARIAEVCEVSLDWLVLGDGGTEPVSRGPSRTPRELAMDLALELRARLHRAEDNGQLDIGDHRTRGNQSSWAVDGTGLIDQLTRDEITRIRAWRTWEERSDTAESLVVYTRSLLQRIRPLLPDDDRELGLIVHLLASSVAASAAVMRDLQPADGPNAFPRLHGLTSSGPLTAPSVAVDRAMASLPDDPDRLPNALRLRIRNNRAVLTP